MNDTPLAAPVRQTASASAGCAFLDGRFCALEDAKISIFDCGFLRSDACQDTVSVWNGMFFRLDDHLARFEQSFKLLRMQCPYPLAEVKRLLLEGVGRSGLREAYVQMIMTRGRMPIGSRDLRLCKNNFMVFFIPYLSIAQGEAAQRGLHLVVVKRRRLPPETVASEIKNYHWIDFDLALLDAYERGADTCVLTDATGHIAEGPGFNVFAVLGGKLVTPDYNVLAGITRKTVFELGAELGVGAEMRRLEPAELHAAEEIFLSSTAGGIVPVTRLEGRLVGTGQTGPVTARLRDLYWAKRNAGWYARRSLTQPDPSPLIAAVHRPAPGAVSRRSTLALLAWRRGPIRRCGGGGWCCWRGGGGRFRWCGGGAGLGAGRGCSPLGRALLAGARWSSRFRGRRRWAWLLTRGSRRFGRRLRLFRGRRRCFGCRRGRWTGRAALGSVGGAGVWESLLFWARPAAARRASIRRRVL
ncbi:MAG: aminotransferase class IV [Gammaproteobacteria bacterium]